MRTEVALTLACIECEAEKLKIPTPMRTKVLEIFRELEAGKRQFGQHNYDELVATGK